MTRCFNSTDTQALSVSLIYDEDARDGHLWMRDNGDPLPLCSSSSLPPTNNCTACVVDQVVYAVCNNISQTVKVAMEDWRTGSMFNITESACPALRPDALESDVNPDSGLSPGAIVGIIFAAVILFAVLIYLLKIRVKKNKERPDLMDGPQAVDLMLDDVKVNNGHVVMA